MDIPLEHDSQRIDKYWRELSDLTIYEAAFWMVIGSDPLAHAERRGQDGAYETYFSDHPGGSMAVEKGCEIIFSAIRCGLIKTTPNTQPNNDGYTTRTRILKTDWISWCLDNGYPEVANRFGQRRKGKDSITVNAKVPREILPISEDWRVQARAIADECFDRDTENKCRDSLKGYSIRVMEEMQERKIKAPRGIIDNPSTVMREALQGVLWWADKPK